MKLKIMRTYHCLPLIIWTCILHTVDNSPLQAKANSHLLRKMANLTKDDGKMLHRTKRGWMWNQFFLLEEYTGTDTQYVGKVRFFFLEKPEFECDTHYPLQQLHITNNYPKIFDDFYYHMVLP